MSFKVDKLKESMRNLISVHQATRKIARVGGMAEKESIEEMGKLQEAAYMLMLQHQELLVSTFSTNYYVRLSHCFNAALFDNAVEFKQ